MYYRLQFQGVAIWRNLEGIGEGTTGLWELNLKFVGDTINVSYKYPSNQTVVGFARYRKVGDLSINALNDCVFSKYNYLNN